MLRTNSGAVGAIAAIALVGTVSLPSATADPTSPGPASPAGDPSSGLLGIDAAGLDADAQRGQDIDRRSGDLAPTTAQRAADRRTGGEVEWNEFGTPATVTAAQGPVARGLAAQPEATARGYLRDNVTLFGLETADVADLETLAVVPVGAGAIVTLRQRIGGLPTTQGGLVTVVVKNGTVLRASSTLSRDTGSLAAAAVDEDGAIERAIAEAALSADATDVLRARQVVVPTPTEGPQRAWEVVVAEKGGEGAAYTVLVNAADGSLLVRESLLDHATDNPEWDLFGSTPADNDDTDRQTWCWTTAEGCDDVVGNPASPLPWDVLDATSQRSTETTIGNNAISGKAWNLPPNIATTERAATPNRDREYVYEFENIWKESGCSPEVFATDDGNDVDAAISSLFAHHNRLHDFAYNLGFTEQTWNAQQNNFGKGGRASDPEVGKAQSGARLGTRNNANQYSTPDGVAPWSNMYLWQPIAGAANVPCVDGDFDGTVIGHEYTHLISNRMVAGPDAGLSGYQAGGMGESWSDLVAMEYLFQLGERPKGDTPYVTGAYVTGDDRQGIRNYDMSQSTLNYSNVGYDVVGQSVHSEGEIWSAANFDVRQAFIDRYGEGTPAELRASFDGEVPPGQAPGSRRWMQLVFDAFLVPATGAVSMVDMRDAMLVADELRFDGANQDIIWNAFASRGLGETASSNGPNDIDPVPSFESPFANDARVRFETRGTGSGPVRIYIGEFEDGSSPVADTDPATPLGDRVPMVAGTYDAVAVGPNVGHQRFQFTVRAGQQRTIPVRVEENLAAAGLGATATGDGTTPERLIDGTESSGWTAERDAPEGVRGLGVNVDLAGDGAQQVSRVNVSAFYESGSRFSALRQFAVEVCDATRGGVCTDADDYDRVFISGRNAFPGDGMRPTSPDLNARSFEIPRSRATHVRLEVLTNQCTGGADFQGDKDNDPANNSDCPTGAPAVARAVRAAEFQVFRR